MGEIIINKVDLEVQMAMAIQSLINHLTKDCGEHVTLKDVLDNTSRRELSGVLFGWLAARDLWTSDIDTDSFIDSLDSLGK